MLTKSPSTQHQQRGAVLFFAVAVLVATTLAGIALTRNVDTGNLIAGNLALHQSAINEGDTGLEQAIAWLVLNNRTPSAICGTDTQILWCNDSSNGYSATFGNPASNESWDHFWNNTVQPSNIMLTMAHNIVTDNTVSYTIERLCTLSGDPDMPIATGQFCSRPPVDKPAGKSKGGSPGVKAQVNVQIYYRVTLRIPGPRNTLSYLQGFIAL